MALTFTDQALESAYQRQRQVFLAKHDIQFGTLLGLIALLWLARLAWLDGSVTPASLLLALLRRGAGFVACCLVPAALARAWGLQAYTRRRHHVALALRLVLQYPVAPGANLMPVLPPAVGPWHALGRLLLVSHGFTLLAVPMSFSLAPLPNAALQAASVALAMRRMPAACRAGYLSQPAVRASLTRVCNWLGHCPTPTPISLPMLDFQDSLAQGPLPCLLMGLWIQLCFLGVLPSLLMCRWEFTARKEWVMGRRLSAAAPGADRERQTADRSRWAASPCPPLWMVLGLFMPAFSMALFRLAGAIALSYCGASGGSGGGGGAGDG